MTKNKSLLYALIFIFLIALIIVLIFNLSPKKNTSIIGNQNILTEINRLLGLNYYQNITVSDFEKIKAMVKGDDYATNELNELVLLAKYKEYSHIGHGLGFIYEYVKTGNQSICPGHSLSHYYVFLRHGENSSAQNNLQEAESNFPVWQSAEQSKNKTYLSDINYTYYNLLINSSIQNINLGNSSASDDYISNLSDAPCV